MKGEIAAYILWVATPLAIYLLGVASGIFFAGLGLYLYRTKHSKNYVCADCFEENCPHCNSELLTNKYCPKCKIVICPQCSNQQQYEKGTTWLKASILLPVTIVIAIVLLIINIWFVPLAYMLYVVFTAPNCNKCGEKLYLSTF